MWKKIKLLDCTLRDGGFALEDAVKNGIKGVEVFDEESRRIITDGVVSSGADVIELGAVQENQKDCKCFAIYQNLNDISAEIPQNKHEGQLFAAFLRGPDIDLKKIPEHTSSMVDITRMCLRYSELEKSLTYSKELAQKGYKVFLQPMVTMRYSEAELKMVIDAANEMNAYAVYFVDSYGYMTPADVHSYYRRFNEALDDGIRIGFHAHNNMDMAFVNAMTLINCCEDDREIILDSCAAGMGQGTGNLQSEVIMDYLNEIGNKNYDVLQILAVCEIVNKYNVNQLWGYTPLRYIAARNKTAYKYATALRYKYNLSYSEICEVLKNLPDNLKFRFTPENTIKILQRKGKV